MKTRYKCKRCNNSAMFVYKGTAEIKVIKAWTGRKFGYKDFHEPIVSRYTTDSLPYACWVCGSTDLTYGRLIDGELEVGHESQGNGVRNN